MDLRTAVAAAVAEADNVTQWPTDAIGNPALVTSSEIRDQDTGELVASFSGVLRLHKLWENTVVSLQTDSKLNAAGEIDVTVEERPVHRPIDPVTFVSRGDLVKLIEASVEAAPSTPATAEKPVRIGRQRNL